MAETLSSDRSQDLGSRGGGKNMFLLRVPVRGFGKPLWDFSSASLSSLSSLSLLSLLSSLSSLTRLGGVEDDEHCDWPAELLD